MENHAPLGPGDSIEVDCDSIEVAGDSIEVDCETCVMRASEACADCLVTYICDREPEHAVVITIDELRAMRTLSDAGLVPRLKHRREVG